MLNKTKDSTSHARRLRRDQTEAERFLWRHLRSRYLNGFKFRRQHALGRFIVEFCCPERGLVVELDGGQHADQAEKDAKRTAYLNRVGCRVVRYWDHDVLSDPEAVLQHIVCALEEFPPQRSPLPPKGEGIRERV